MPGIDYLFSFTCSATYQADYNIYADTNVDTSPAADFKTCEYVLKYADTLTSYYVLSVELHVRYPSFTSYNLVNVNGTYVC